MHARIYALKSPDTDKVYIGSTHRSLSSRFSEHQRDMKLIQAGQKLWRKTRATQLLTYPSVYIELVEEFDCDTKEEIHIREREAILRHREVAVNYLDPVSGKKLELT